MTVALSFGNRAVPLLGGHTLDELEKYFKEWEVQLVRTIHDLSKIMYGTQQPIIMDIDPADIQSPIKHFEPVYIQISTGVKYIKSSISNCWYFVDNLVLNPVPGTFDPQITFQASSFAVVQDFGHEFDYGTNLTKAQLEAAQNSSILAPEEKTRIAELLN